MGGGGGGEGGLVTDKQEKHPCEFSLRSEFRSNLSR